MTIVCLNFCDEAVHMLGYSDLMTRSSIEMNTIWEPFIDIRLDERKMRYDLG